MLNSVTPGRHAQLPVDRLGMRLDRVDRHVQLPPDLAERERALKQAEHFQLAIGKRAGQRRCGCVKLNWPHSDGCNWPRRRGDLGGSLLW